MGKGTILSYNDSLNFPQDFGDNDTKKTEKMVDDLANKHRDSLSNIGKPRFIARDFTLENRPEIILNNYIQFSELKEGDYRSIWFGDGMPFFAYLEKRTEWKTQQRVLLQHKHRIDSGPVLTNKSRVSEYLLPLTGKLKKSDFLEGMVAHYDVREK
jgi:hypothetical protein